MGRFAVSVIVPSYQQQPFLAQTLRSVLGQGFADVEVLVLDGGSTDGSKQVIEDFAPALAFWRSHADAGQAAAINEGMSRASGSLLCWLNSDDLQLPWTLQVMVKAAAESVGRPALYYGGSAVFREGAAFTVVGRPPEPFDRPRLAHDDYIVQPSAFWTRELWAAVGPLREDLHFAFDWEWWLRASACVDLQHVPRLLSLYRIHDSHKTGVGGAKRRAEVVSVAEQYADQRWARLYAEVALAMDRHPDLIEEKRLGTGRRQRWALLSRERGRRWVRTALREPGAYLTVFRMLQG